MKNAHVPSLLLLVLSSMLTVSRCGQSPQKDTASSSSEIAANSEDLVVSGWIVKGPVNGATVDIYSIDPRGNADQLLDTTTSNEDGSFSFSLASVPVQAFIVKSSGGSYLDEASRVSTEFAPDQGLASVLTKGAALTSVSVTPLTSIAAKLMPHIIAENTENIHTAAKIHAAITQATAQVAAAFDLSEVDITHIIPRDLVSTPVEAGTPATMGKNALLKNAAIVRYSLAISAMSQYMQDQGQNPEGLKNLMTILVATIPRSGKVADADTAGQGFFKHLSTHIERFVAQHQLAAQVNAVIDAAVLAKDMPDSPDDYSRGESISGSASASTSANPLSTNDLGSSSASQSVPSTLSTLSKAVLNDITTIGSYGDLSVIVSTVSAVTAMSFDAVNRRLYLAGTVVKREQAFNPFRALDAKNGAIISSFAPKIPGTIYDIADDGNGGNYIAGSFSLVNGQALNALVHCNADGSVDSTFAPVIEGLINAIKLSPDKGTLYLGGTFTKVGGVTYNNIAAVNARTGAAITTFNPNANGRVRTMALSASGGILYFGGTFTKVDGVTYNRIAAVATSTGAALSTFNPNADGEVHALVLTSDESTLYMGGSFSRAGGLSRYGVAKIATSNGNVNSSFIPNFTVLMGMVSSHGVFSLALSANEGTLYLGGSFHLEGASNDSLSAVSTSNGARIATFSPKISAMSGTNSVSEVWGMALAPTGGTLYISGWFSYVGDSATRVAAVSSSTGAILTTYKWPDKLITYNNSGAASYPLLFETEIKLAISPNGAALYLLGAYAKSTGVSNFITKSLNPTTGTLASPFITTNGPVSAIAGSADGATLYVGGNFLNIGTEVYNTLAAVTTASATLVRSFKPNPNYPSEVKALALSADGGTLYLGGSFTSLGGTTTNVPSAPNNFYTNGGVTYNKLGAVSTSTAAAVSTFNPNLGTGMVYAMALSPDGGTLYIGGSFVTVGGATYNRVAAVNTANGAVITSFNPNVDNTVNALALSTDGTILYMGGSFTTIAGASYKRVAAVSTANGAAISSFNPNVDNTVNALALSADGGTLYLGGAFTTVGGAAASMLAGVATANGTVISGITPAVVGTVNVLLRSGSTLFVGGTFGAIYGDVAYPGSFISSGF